MGGFPNFAIPPTLPFLNTKELCKCACISREWMLCVQLQFMRIRKQSARVRAQLTDEEKDSIDKEMVAAAENGETSIVEDLVKKGGGLERMFDIRLPEWAKEATPLGAASVNNHLETARVIIKHGAEVNAKADDGGTALMAAAFEGHHSIVQLLVDNGGKVNARAADGFAAMTAAAVGGYSQIVKFLIERGSDVNGKEKDGRTALMVAASVGHLEVVKVLIEEGADLHETDENGKKAVDLAEENRFPDVACALLEAAGAMEDSP